MTTASTLHLLALGACFLVQFGAPEVSRMPGIRRAIQTMESARDTPSLVADEADLVRFCYMALDDFQRHPGKSRNAEHKLTRVAKLA
jgi:hypothetical protein